MKKKLLKTAKPLFLFLISLFLLVGCVSIDMPDSTEKSETMTKETETGDKTSGLIPESTGKSGETEEIKNTGKTAEQSEAASGSGVPILRFAVASDIHIKTYTSVERTRFKELFEEAYAYAKTQEYKKLDAVVVAGDFTDSGKPAEYDAFNSIWKSCIADETQMIVFMGNHEWGTSNYTDFESRMGMPASSDNVINGFHFIGVSPKHSDYSSQFKWLEEKLNAAADEDSEKPVFTFQHHHMKDTVYVSEEWYTDQLNDIYSGFTQTINFSGHSHAPVNNPRSIYQKDYTLLGTGTLSYFECLSGMTYGTVPPDAGKAAQFYIVEAYADNSVRILPYNLLTHDFFKETSGSSDKRIELYIDAPSDKSTFRYTDKRYETADAPVFPEGTKDATISDISSKGATVSFTQATDGECIYSYEICIKKSGADKADKTYRIFSEYYFEPMPETLSYALTGLTANTAYTVEITAIDCFGKRSKNQISAEFKTSGGGVFIKYTGSGGTYKGTFTDFESYKSFTKGKCFVYNNTGSVGGDYWMGAWESAAEISASRVTLSAGKGYKGSTALGLSENAKENQGLYLYATQENNNLNSFEGTKYLRVWMNLTGMDFRKANFGIFDYNGNLFTTDEQDGASGLSFYYLPDDGTGSTPDGEWKRYEHGNDGCFGAEQNSSVAGLKGWFAFPISDFRIRDNANPSGYAKNEFCPLSQILGVYFFWDYDDKTKEGTEFYLDEISFVEDYKAFTPRA